MSSMGKRKRPGAWASAIARRSRSKGRVPFAASLMEKHLGLELKYVDYTYGVTDIVATVAGSEVDPPTALCLNALAVGTGESERVGRRCVVKSYDIRGLITMSSLSSDAVSPMSKSVRLLLVWDKQTNKGQLNAEDVLRDAAGYDVNSMINLDYQDRFKILKDQLFKLDYSLSRGTATVNLYGGKEIPFHWKGKLNMPVTFTDDAAIIADISDNSLHVIAIGSQPTSPATLAYTSRVRFLG